MLVVISNPEVIEDEAVIINQLFDEGMPLFHLRKPNYSREELTTLLNQIKSEYYSKISLHQYHEMANDFGINRLHFTEKNRLGTQEDMLQNLKKESLLSTSVHSVGDYKNLGNNFEYSFFGPVFNSISKEGYHAALGNGFSVTNIKNKTKIIAIGGINQDNITKVFDMGFDGAAVLGAIWQSPKNAICNFKLIMEEWKKTDQ